MSFQQSPMPPTQSGKLPIPRLNRPLDRPKKPPKKSDVLRQGRVARACLSCRARKVKCNGAQPRCQNCVDDSVPCVYPASRKDRLKTLVMSLSCSFLPMLMLSRHSLDREGLPVEWVRSVYRGDRYKFVARLKRPVD